MKRLFSVCLVLLIALMPVLGIAAPSKQNQNIPETEVIDVIPEDQDKEVVQPEVKIIPDTEEIIELREEMQTIYHLKIRYVYVDGSTAAGTYSATLETGTAYSVPSPSIAGYTPTTGLVSGVMPARDVQYLVVYLTGETENPIFPYSEMSRLFNMEDYETPLGLGSSIINVGICFE